MAHHPPNNLIELAGQTAWAMAIGAITLIVAGFVVGAFVLVVMR